MCHFLAPVGQPEMMHKNFMRRHLRISVARCSGMKFFAHFQLNTPLKYPTATDMAMKRYRDNDTSLRSWRRTRQG